jgi:phosphoglycerate kinase
LVEDDKVELAKELIEKAGDKLVLPVDNVVADKFANDAEYKTVEGDIPDGYMALDVGEKSVELFKETLKDAKTVVWNGPMGVFEMPNFAKGTLALGEFLATLSDATTIVGGGDSVAAAKQLGIADKLSHVSTGGGSSLEYLEGKTLPAIAVLSEK